MSNNNPTTDTLEHKLDRLIAAVERLSAPLPVEPDFEKADCFVWEPEQTYLAPVLSVNRVDIGLIQGVDLVRDQLVENG